MIKIVPAVRTVYPTTAPHVPTHCCTYQPRRNRPKMWLVVVVGRSLSFSLFFCFVLLLFALALFSSFFDGFFL